MRVGAQRRSRNNNEKPTIPALGDQHQIASQAARGHTKQAARERRKRPNEKHRHNNNDNVEEKAQTTGNISGSIIAMKINEKRCEGKRKRRRERI